MWITQIFKVITEAMKHSGKLPALHLSFVDIERWQIPRKILVIHSITKLLTLFFFVPTNMGSIQSKKKKNYI